MTLPIQQPGVTEKLRGLFALVGRIRLRLDETVSPVVIVDDLSQAGEVERLAFVGQIGVASGVGNQNFIRLCNPAESGVVAVVEQITVHQPNADQFDIALQAGSLAGANGFFRDARVPGRAACRSLVGTPVAAVLGPLQFDILAATDFVLDMEWILPPNTLLQIRQLNQNETLHVNFVWRERNLRPDQR